MDPNVGIDAIRLSTSFSLRSLLTETVLGTQAHTEAVSYSLSGTTRVVYTPVSVASFGGRRSSFPLVKTSMVATTAITVVLMNWMSPLSAEIAPRTPPVQGHHSASEAAVLRYTPSDPERYARAQRLHKAAMEAQSEAAASASSSSVMSESALSSSSPTSADDATTVDSSAASSKEASTPPVLRADNKQGVYLSASSVGRAKFLEDTMKSIVDSGGNSIVFDVKGGVVFFHSAAPMANDLGLVKPSYDLKEVLDIAKKYNLYTIGRFVAIKDYGFTQKKPLTRVRNPKTGSVISQDWIDPSDDTAIEYNAQVMCNAASYGIDEMNMDYIRFSTSQVGALRVYSGEEKSDRVEKFIMAMREAINRCGPATKLGISTYAILGWNYSANVETLGQDVVRFAPLVDVISPMAYPATFTSPEYYMPGKNPGPRMYWLVYRTLKGYTDLLGPDHRHKIRPWIQGYFVDTNDVSDQIRAVYDAGFCGFQVWNAGNNYRQSYSAMKKDKLKPERCLDTVKIADVLP